MMRKLKLAAAWLVAPALAMWLSAGPDAVGPRPSVRSFALNSLARLVLLAAAAYLLAVGYWQAAALIGALLVLLAVTNFGLFLLLRRQRRAMREYLQGRRESGE